MKVRPLFAWYDPWSLRDEDLVEQIAREIYNLTPWCRPYERPGLTPGVGIVPWNNLEEHRTGRDLRRKCEVKARAAGEALSEEQLATKSDISKLERELLVIKWMLGLVIVAVVLPLIKPFFS